MRDGALGLKLRPRENGGGGDLGAGAAGGGNRREGKRVARAVRRVEIAFAAVTVLHHEGDGLGGVHRGAPADADDEIRALRQAEIPGLHDRRHRRIFLDFIEYGVTAPDAVEGRLDVPQRAVLFGGVPPGDDEGLAAQRGEIRGVMDDDVIFFKDSDRHVEL